MKVVLGVAGGIAAYKSCTLLRLLSEAGHDVTIVERDAIPGGRAGMITEQGFRLDNGPTVLTMPNLLEDAFNAAGAEMKNFVTINLDDDAINNVSVIEVLDGLVNGGEEVLSRANVIYGDLWGAGRGI